MRFLVLVLLAFLAVAAAAADKIVADPNAKAKAQGVELKSVDQRLLKKVTVDFPSGRLHALIDRISERSGVSIKCGNNLKDWQVRDLPVIAYARDFPLGKLLRGIAESTQLALSAEMVDGVQVYRIYRDYPRRKAVENYLASVDKAALDKVGWQWDTLAALATLPEADTATAEKRLENSFSMLDWGILQAYGKLFAALGSDAKARLLAGNRVVLSTDEGSQAMRDAAMDVAKRPMLVESWHPDDSSQGQVSKATLVLSLGNSPPAKLSAEICRNIFGTALSSTNVAFDRPIETASGYLKDWPKCPKAPERPEPGYQGFEDIKAHPEALQQKIRIPKPKDDRITLSSAVKAVGEASGYAIVCEDYVSHLSNLRPPQLSDYGKDTTLESALQALEFSGRLDLRINPDDRVIIGPAREWWERHTRLVPASVLAFVKQKLDGPGMQLDDALMILRLSEGQLQDWVYASKDLSPLQFSQWKKLDPLWTFYDSLGAPDKALARSAQGLPLATFNPQFVAQLFAASENLRNTDIVLITQSALRKPSDPPEKKLPSDPAAIQGLSLYMASHPRRSVYVFDPRDLSVSNRDSQDGILRYSYVPTIKGKDFSLQISGIGMEFPVYSLNREQEILKANARKPGNTANSK